MKRLVAGIWRPFSKMVARVIGARAHEYLYYLYLYYLRGGWRRVWRRRHDKSTGKGDFLAVCAIVKDEGSYLREWIEFHRVVGVQRFYIYLNDCTDDTVDVLRPYADAGLVEMIEFNGECRQVPAYEDCINRHFRDAEWIAFIDLDEFIVPTEGQSLVDYLALRKESCCQVLLKWLFFGSNGQQRRRPGLVIERFTRRAERKDKMCTTKGIVRPRFVYEVAVHQHRVAGITGFVDIEKIRIHHYFCKSWEEFTLRAPRGDVALGADYAFKKYSRKIFDARDLNDIEDLSALRFLPAIKKGLALL